MIEEKYLNSSTVKQLLEGIKEYINEQDNIREVDTQLIGEQLVTETVRAVGAENELSGKIATETILRTSQIENLQQTLQTETTERMTSVQNAVSTLTEQTQDYTNTVRSEILTSMSNKDHELDVKIQEATGVARTLVQNETQRATNSESNLSARINAVSTDMSTVRTTVNNHVNSKNAATATVQNPHGITPQIIGAPTLDQYTELSAEVATLKESMSDTTPDDSVSEAVITEINDRISQLDSVVLKTSGDQIFDGTLRVTGNLVVDGETTTITEETLSVSDSKIILNSEGGALADTVSGVLLRDSEDSAKGIVFDTTLQYVSGSYVDSVFTPEVSKTVLTIDSTSSIQTGDTLVWDSDAESFVPGEITFDYQLPDNVVTTETLEPITSSLTDVQTQLSTISTDVSVLQTTTTTLRGDVDSLVASTSDTATIVNDHTTALNPHNITWTTIKDEALSDSVPQPNGYSTAGTSDQVARADHVHPRDNNVAPVSHTATDGVYGEATANLFGHVKVDAAISDSSINPVQNKVIKEYIDTVVNGYGVASNTFEPDETIASVVGNNGVVETTKQRIQISTEQVDSLDTKLEELYTLTSAATTSIEVLKTADTSLQASIGTEVKNRQDADAVVIDTLTKYVDARVSETVLTVEDTDVILSKPFVATCPMGRYALPESGSYTLGVKEDGSLMSWRELLEDVYSYEQVGGITLPECVLETNTDANLIEGEVGTEFNIPVATFKVVNNGRYQFGPDTGITISALVSDGESQWTNTQMHEGDELSTVAEETVRYFADTPYSKTFTCTYNYTDATTAPLTNKGNSSEDNRITRMSGLTSETSVTFNGYRKCFMGGTSSTSSYTLSTSGPLIRQLSEKVRYAPGSYITTAAVNNRKVVWAFPEMYQTKAIFEYELFGSWQPLKGVIGPVKVPVNDARGLNPITYNVYTFTAPYQTFGASFTTRVTVE